MPVTGNGDILPFYDILYLFVKPVTPKKIAHTDGFFIILIGIYGRYAALRGAVFFIGKTFFLHAVEHLMIRHTNDGLIADFEIIRSDSYALFLERLYLAGKMFDIDNHAVAHDIYRCIAKYARREQVHYKLALFVYNGMACVVAALVTADDVIIGGKQIHHSPLSFITPVDSYDSCKHFVLPSLYIYFVCGITAYILRVFIEHAAHLGKVLLCLTGGKPG